MLIFPAIDIQDGECVRLTKGDFATAERVAEDPLQTALSFQEAGAEWIHMVDLDGAKTAQMQNRDVFIMVAKETDLKVEVGGGIRDAKTAAYYLEHGVERVILGSAAVRSPKLIAELVREYGDRIAVGIDAEDGIVKIDGGLNTGRVSILTLAREMDFIGVRHIIYTDISKDGTLAGPNLTDLKRLRDSVRLNVIASGGIHDLADITELGKLRLYGAICGKSLYRGTLDLKEAIEEGAKYTPIELPDPEEADEAMETEYLAALEASKQAAARAERQSSRYGQSRGGAGRSQGSTPRSQGGSSRPQGGAPRSQDGSSRPQGGSQRAQGGERTPANGNAGNRSGAPKGANANPAGGKPAPQGKPGGKPAAPAAGGNAPGGEKPKNGNRPRRRRPRGKKPGGPNGGAPQGGPGGNGAGNTGT